MRFDEKFMSAPVEQKARYVRLVNSLGITLSEDEKKYILWLAGWDKDTEDVFAGLFAKLRQGK